MKSLTVLNNVEKAKLLFDLFPEEIPSITGFIAGLSQTLKEEEQATRTNWENKFIDFDYWLQLADTAEDKIQHYGARLNQRSSLFADQLFDGMLAVYTIHCIRTYVTIRQHPNRKLVTAFDLLFDL